MLPLAPGPKICGTLGQSALQCGYMHASTLASLLLAPVLCLFILAVHYTQPSDSRDWVVEFGASHHVTTYLDTLSLHEPYSGSESVFIGDDVCLSITYTGSFSLSTLHFPLIFSKSSMCAMSKNLISVSALYPDNPINRGEHRDGVYYW